MFIIETNETFKDKMTSANLVKVDLNTIFGI